jgi:hypothetical protein
MCGSFCRLRSAQVLTGLQGGALQSCRRRQKDPGRIGKRWRMPVLCGKNPLNGDCRPVFLTLFYVFLRAAQWIERASGR